MIRKPGLVSIVVTAYNRRPYIQPCLQSLIRQTYRNIEIIVVDDGSNDKTLLSVQKWQRRLPYRWRHRIRLVRLPRNSGYSGALTTGMFLAKGKYVAVQDSDDLSHPQRIEQQVRFLRNHHDIGMVGTNYGILHHGKVVNEGGWWLRYGSEAIQSSYAAGNHCICMGTLMLRGEVFDQWGGLTRRMPTVEDYEFIDKLVLGGVLAENLNEVLYFYRRHSKQRSKPDFGDN